jgi:hypothetical protein
MTLRHSSRTGQPHGDEAPSWRWVFLALAILVLIILTARAAAAENLGPGGGSRLIVGDEIVGAYRLLATSSPNPATTGTVTYVVRVSDPQSGAKVRDVQVAVELTSPDGATVLEEAATHQNAGNDIDYAAHIPIQQAGSWNGVIRVSGSAGSSEVKFLQTVSTPRTISTVILVGIPFLVMLGVFGAMYYVRAGGRKAAAV